MMRLLFFKSFICLLLLSFLGVFANSFSLSTQQNYNINYDVNAAQEWVENIREARHVMLDGYENLFFHYNTNSARNRRLFAFSTYLINFPFVNAGAVTLHEVAHAEKAANFGVSSSFGVGSESGLDASSLYWRKFGFNSNAYTEFYGTFTDEEFSDVFAAGMNANTQYSRELYRRFIIEDEVRLYDVFDYTYNKFLASAYFIGSQNNRNPDGDPSLYVENLKDLGVETSVNDILIMQVISLFFSGGLKSTYEAFNVYTISGQKSLVPGYRRWHDIRFYRPEHSVYLNRDNVSYAVEGYLRNSEDRLFTYGVESSVKGVSQPAELLLGVTKSFNHWGLDSQLFFNVDSNYFLDLTLERRLSYLTLFTRALIGDGRTMKQKRDWITDDQRILAGFAFRY